MSNVPPFLQPFDWRGLWRGFVNEFVHGFDPPHIKASLQSNITEITGWIVYVITFVAASVAQPLAKGILEAFTINRTTWAGIMAAFTHELTGVTLRTEDLVGSPPGEPLLPFLRAFGASLGEIIFSVLAPQNKPTPADGRLNAESVFALSSKFNLQAWYGSMVGELVSLGRIRSLGLLPEAVERSFGLNRITRLVLRAPVQFGITNPLTEYYNRLYEPTLLPVADVIEGWQRQLLTDDAAIDALHGHGWSYDNILLLMNLRQKDFSLTEARQLYETRLIDVGTLERIVRRAGFGEDRTRLMLQLITEDRSTKILDELASTARRLWRDGHLTSDETRQILTEAHWSREEVDLALVHEELALREDKALSTTQLVDAFEIQAIDATELRTRLRTRRFTDADIDILLALKTKRLSAAQIVEARLRGRIDDARATAELRSLGYRPEDIPVLLDLRGKTLTEGQILDALSRGLLNVSDARSALASIGVDAAAIDLLLSFQRKTLSAADIQAALLRGLLSADQARQRLLETGYNVVDADLLLRLRFRLLTRGEIMDAYEAGLVSRPEAATLLGQRGFTGEEAETLLAVTDRKVARTGRRAPAAPQPPAAP